MHKCKCKCKCSGVVTLIKEKAPNAVATHCMLHREALVAKHIEDDLHQVPRDVVKTELCKITPLENPWTLQRNGLNHLKDLNHLAEASLKKTLRTGDGSLPHVVTKAYHLHVFLSHLNMSLKHSNTSRRKAQLSTFNFYSEDYAVLVYI